MERKQRASWQRRLLCLLPLWPALSSEAFQIPIIRSRNKKASLGGDSRKILGVERKIDIPADVFPSEWEIENIEKDMPGCEHGWFTSVHEDAKLHYRKFLPSSVKDPKAIVIWMHGIQSLSGEGIVLDDGRKLNMALVSDTFGKMGYACYAFDQYGHGYSEGNRFYVPDWKVNRDDYINFINMVASQHDENTPLFLCGESYGGCLTLHVAKHFQDNPQIKPKGFDSILLLAPAIMCELPPKIIYWALRYILAPLFPRWVPFFMPNPVSADRIWRDPKVRAHHECERKKEMGLGGGGRAFRLGTGASLLKALHTVRTKVIPDLHVPFCVVHGQEDNAVPIEGTDYLLKHSQTPSHHRAVRKQEGAYHDLLGDPSAEDIMNFIVDWTSQRLKEKEPVVVKERTRRVSASTGKYIRWLMWKLKYRYSYQMAS